MRGTTVKLAREGFTSHLWIVVSDPHPEQNLVLAFNLTDEKHYPSSACILLPGEHEFIEKRSAVRYFSPKLWEAEQLKARIQDGTFREYAKSSEALLAKIVRGAYFSEDLEPHFLRFLPPDPCPKT